MSKWNIYNESLLQKWSSMSKTYSIMHTIASSYYKTLDNRLTIPVILLGAFTASSIFTTAGNLGKNDFWIYFNGSLALITTGLSGVSKFLGTHEKISKHMAASFKYTQVSMNIETLLSFTIDERTENPRDFINNIKLSILELREYSPDLPTWIVEDYIKKYDKSLTNTNTKVACKMVKNNSNSIEKDMEKEVEDTSIRIDIKEHNSLDFTDSNTLNIMKLCTKMDFE